MADFSFETNPDYIKYSGRLLKNIRASIFIALFFSPISIIVLIVKDGYSNIIDELELFFGIFVALFTLFAIPSSFAVINYITKFTIKDGIINIERSVFNNTTSYYGNLTDFEIQKKKSLWRGGRRKAVYYLHIKCLKDGVVINQFDYLDWEDKVMDNLIAALNEPKTAPIL